MHKSFFLALHSVFPRCVRYCLALLTVLWMVSPLPPGKTALGDSATTVASAQPLQYKTMAQRYNEAQKYVTMLEKDPELGKKRENWLIGLRNFRKIYLAEKESAYGSPSLFMMAKLSQQMHARFQVPLDLDNAIEFFLELADLYPASSLADDALYAAAEAIRRHKPEDPRPLELYQRIIDVYAKGDFQVRALERLNQEKQQHTPKGSRPVTPVLAKDPGYRLARILPVKYWSSQDYTRVVIQASAPVHFDSRLLEKDGNRPRRLYLDFTPSLIQPAIRQPIVIQDGLLKQIRTAQFDNSTVRVVLDLESLSDYKMFSLNDPFRIIVDVHGARPGREEKRAIQEQREILERLAALQKTPENTPEQAENAQDIPTVQQFEEIQETQEEPVLPSIKHDPSKARIAVIQLQDRKKIQLSSPAASTIAKTPVTAPITGKPVKNQKTPPISLREQLGLGVSKIVIDPGHGGKDPGAMAFSLKEKDIVLNVSKKVASILREKKYEVELTRNTDVHIPLEERTAIANTRHADLFISVHINAHPDKKIGGVETYFLNLATDADAMRVAALENATSTHNISELQDILSNLMNNSKIDESSRLAHFVQTNLAGGLKKQYKIRDLGVKQAPFYVLIGAEMPAVLVEISFITNPEEAKLLQNEAYLRTIAEQIASGIVAYVHHHSAAVYIQ